MSGLTEFLKGMEPALANLLLDGGKEFAKYVWHQLTGRGDTDADEDVLKAIGAEALAGLLEAARAKAENEAAARGLPVALHQLDIGARKVLAAFETAGGHIPTLDLEVTKVEKFDDEPDDPKE